MARLTVTLCVLVVGVFVAFHAEAYDRVASVGQSPFTAEPDATGVMAFWSILSAPWTGLLTLRQKYSFAHSPGL